MYQDMGEDLVLMRVLRDSNMPKFVFEDVPLFAGLINDLFPGMDCPRVGYEDLKVCAMADFVAKGFRCTNDKVHYEQVDKVIQMYETQLVRHTTMIVGPTGGGKSLVLETLKNSRLTAENVVVKMYVGPPPLCLPQNTYLSPPKLCIESQGTAVTLHVHLSSSSPCTCSPHTQHICLINMSHTT